MDKLDKLIQYAFPKYGTNEGHGHVWSRPDRKLYRCGGTTLCKACQHDANLLMMVRNNIAEGMYDHGKDMGSSGPALRPQVDGEVATLGYN